MKDLLMVAFVAAAIVFGPLLIIWCLNAVFSLAVPYTLKTWFGVAVLTMVAGR